MRAVARRQCSIQTWIEVRCYSPINLPWQLVGIHVSFELCIEACDLRCCCVSSNSVCAAAGHDALTWLCNEERNANLLHLATKKRKGK